MKKWIQKQKQFKNERGLTLVELLAVIVILAIVATIAFVAIGKVIENSKQDALIGSAQQMIESAKLYEATEGDIPDEGVTLKNLQNSGYIEVVKNPWTKSKLAETDLDSSKVTKNEDVYEVTLQSSGGNITGKSEDEILNDKRENLVINR